MGKRVMSVPISARMTCAAVGSDAGDLIQPGHHLRERGDLLLDPGVQRSDVAADRIDAGQHLAEQERVMFGEVAGERLFQQDDLLPQGPPGQLRQHLRVALTGHQRGHHVPAGDPENVGGHHAQLDLGVFQQLLRPLLLRGAGAHQVSAVAVRSRSRRICGGGTKLGPEHLPLGNLSQPDRIQLVGLRPARQVLSSHRGKTAARRSQGRIWRNLILVLEATLNSP